MSMQPYFHELQMSEKKIWCKNEISRISSSTLMGSFHNIPQNNLYERLQRVNPLHYPPANLIRGKLSFYWSS